MFDFGLSILASIFASGIYSEASKKKIEQQLHDALKNFGPTEGLHLMRVSSDEITPKKDLIYQQLSEKCIPTKKLIAEALYERWLLVRQKLSKAERQEFFNISEEDSKKHFEELSIVIWRILASCSELQGSVFEQQLEMQKEEVEKIISKIDEVSKSREFERLAKYSVKETSVLNAVFPGSNITIDEIYVSPLAKSLAIADDLMETVIYKDVVEEAISFLEMQDCLVIKGGYGSGKSIILKSIRNKLIESSIAVFYFGGIEWTEYLESKPNIDNLVKESSLVNGFIYLIIDSIEDFCDFGEDHGQENHYEKIFFTLQKISKNTNIKLLVSLRDIFIDDTDMIIKLCDLYSKTSFPENVKVITLDGFNSERRREWIEKFEYIIDADKTNYKLANLRKNKKLAGIIRNPLGLYVLSRDLISSDIGVEQLNVTSYYTSFIASTIKGKFSEESRRGAYFLKKHNLIDEYRDFIKGLCVQLFKISESSKDQDNKDIDYFQEWPLDPNIIKYDNTRSEAQKIAAEFINRNTNLSIQGEKKQSSILAYLLSCYFFSWKEHSITLKDDNILHYFLAEDVIEKLSASSQHNERVFLESINISGQAINYCTEFITCVSECAHSKIAENATKIVTNFLFGEQDQVDKIFLTRKSIKNIILLFILCLKMNWLNLASPKKDKILQVVPLLLWMDENFKLGYKSLIFRSLYGVRLDNQIVKSIDFDDFNFSFSTLNNVTFENCSFRKTLFSKATFNSVEFSNCTFNKTEFDNAEGRVTFNYCEIYETKIDNVPFLEMKFLFSRIRHSIIDISTSNVKLQNKKLFLFSRTFLEDVTFKQKSQGKKLVVIELNNCMLSSVVAKNSIVDIYTSDSLLVGKGMVDNEAYKPVSNSSSEIRYRGSNEQMEL